jgi:hypothetical protein
MTANAVTFATPPVPMATLQTQATTYDAKLIARFTTWPWTSVRR